MTGRLEFEQVVAIARLNVVVQCLAASCDAKKVIWFPYKTGPESPDGLNETAGERGAKEEQKAGKQTCAPFATPEGYSISTLGYRSMSIPGYRVKCLPIFHFKALQ